jgi:hypothetical protein
MDQLNGDERCDVGDRCEILPDDIVERRILSRALTVDDRIRLRVFARTGFFGTSMVGRGLQKSVPRTAGAALATSDRSSTETMPIRSYDVDG